MYVAMYSHYLVHGYNGYDGDDGIKYLHYISYCNACLAEYILHYNIMDALLTIHSFKQLNMISMYGIILIITINLVACHLRGLTLALI